MSHATHLASVLPNAISFQLDVFHACVRLSVPQQAVWQEKPKITVAGVHGATEHIFGGQHSTINRISRMITTTTPPGKPPYVAARRTVVPAALVDLRQPFSLPAPPAHPALRPRHQRARDKQVVKRRPNTRISPSFTGHRKSPLVDIVGLL